MSTNPSRRAEYAVTDRLLNRSDARVWFQLAEDRLGGEQLASLLGSSLKPSADRNAAPSLPAGPAHADGASIIPSPGEPGIAPNFDNVVTMNEGYTVPAGTTYYTTSLYWMFTSTTLGSVLVNNGALWNIGGNSEIVRSQNFGLVFNSGLMVADSPAGFAIAVYVFSNFGGLFNYGRIFALADDSWATGVEDWSSYGAFFNSGLIAVQSLQAVGPFDISVTARGVQRTNGGRVLNTETGSILAEGAIANAISLGRGHTVPPGWKDEADLENAGRIEARSTDPLHPSVAVAASSLDTEIMTVLNSGMIRGDIAIAMGGQVSIGPQRAKTIINYASGLIDGAINLGVFNETLFNLGRIEGDVNLAGGSDFLFNAGTMVGTVSLGGASDLWYSPTGQLQGAVFGGDGSDMLFGSVGVDALNGEGADDVIRGGLGGDQLSGGAGRDVFVYASVGDSTEAAFDTITDFTSGADRIDLTGLGVQSFSIEAGAGFAMLRAITAAGTLALRVNGALSASDVILANIPNVGGTADADMLHATAGGSILTGGEGNDALFGSTGNDRLDGGADGDTMWGGVGDDVYTVDSNGDVLWEIEGQGRDTVEVYYHDYYRMPDNVEDVVAFDPDYTFIFGNGLNNRMVGNAAANTFFGGDGKDVIVGGGGVDRLQGDADADRLTGGSGADFFIFTKLADSLDLPPRSDGRKFLADIITDFTSGEDKINLQEIDAIPGGIDNSFTFIGTGIFTGTAGQLRYDVQAGLAHIYADVDGDGYADMHIIANTNILVASDFML